VGWSCDLNSLFAIVVMSSTKSFHCFDFWCEGTLHALNLKVCITLF
jgi:hypothetical protein